MIDPVPVFRQPAPHPSHNSHPFLKSPIRNSIPVRFLLCWLVTLLSAQNVDRYLALLEQGRLEEVRTALPDLLAQYPDNPGVLYLKGVAAVNGDSSVAYYRRLIQRYPNSPYADDAAVRIGEYLYARGLYSQASEQLRSVPLLYPRSEHAERAMELMVRSYRATGEVDSARHYLRLFKRTIPDIDYQQFGISGLEVEPEVALVKVDQSRVKQKLTEKKPSPKKKKPVMPPSASDSRPWVVQVGAFGKYDNARRLKKKLTREGYQVVLGEVISNGRRLHTVRVTRYATREEANRVGIQLKMKFGLDYRVLKSPE
jgi:outer membrane protein assembly factor BamD (BamD/ComL family)